MNETIERFEVEGLGEERRSGAPRILDRAVVGERADDDRADANSHPSELSHEAGAVDSGKTVVGDNDVRRWWPDLRKGFFGAPGDLG
ncbi:MAG TPA: hypothetical protein VK989_16150, partial [Polyangia bacterium]|nr:hypothetical protein [Polyangia bacterium]